MTANSFLLGKDRRWSLCLFSVRNLPTAEQDTIVADASTCPYAFRVANAGHADDLVNGLTKEGKQYSDPWAGKKDTSTEMSTLHVLTIGIDHYGSESGLTTTRPASVSSADELDKFFSEQRNSPAKLFSDIEDLEWSAVAQ